MARRICPREDEISQHKEAVVTATPQGPELEAPFFTAIRSWGITRGEHRVLGGVVEGVGERIGLDRTPARIIAFVLALMTSGLFLTAYAAAWALLPDREGRIIVQDFGRGTPNVPALVGIAIVGLIGFHGLAWVRPAGWGWAGAGIATLIGLMFVFAIVAFIVWLVIHDDHGHTRAAARSAAEEAKAAGADAADQIKAAANEIKKAAKGSGDDIRTAAHAVRDDAKSSGKKIAEEGRATAHRAKVAAAEMREAVTTRAVPGPEAAADSTASGNEPPAPPAYVAPPRPLRPRVPGPGRGIRLLGLAASLLAAAAVWWADREDILSVNPIEAWLAIEIVIVGFAIILAGAAGRRIGVFGFWATVLVIGWTIRIIVGPQVDDFLNSHDVMIGLDGPPRVVSVHDGTVNCRNFDQTLRDRAMDIRVVADEVNDDVTITQPNTTIVVPIGASITVESAVGDTRATLSWERYASGREAWSEYGTCEIDGPMGTFYTVGHRTADVTVTVDKPGANIVIEER